MDFNKSCRVSRPDCLVKKKGGRDEGEGVTRTASNG